MASPLTAKILPLALTIIIIVLSGCASFSETHPLSMATKEGDKEKVNALLRNGVNANETSLNCVTALMRASIDGKTDIVKALVAVGKKVKRKTSRTPPHSPESTI